MNHREFPDECIRGISNQSDLAENNAAVRVTAFQFQKERFNDEGWITESINWKDDEHTVNFTLNQKKENTDKFQFIAVTCIPRSELESIRKRFPLINTFNYERDPEENVNKYHGNLLIRKEASSHIKSMIRGFLTWHCKIIIMREEC